MSSTTITFPVERIGYVGNFTNFTTRKPQMEVSLVMTQEQKRAVLKQLGATVDGETLAKWIEEDLHMEIAP